MAIIELDINDEQLPNIERMQVFQFYTEEIDNHKLEQMALELEKKEKTVFGSNVGGYHSKYDLFKNSSDIEVQKLNNLIIKTTGKILNKNTKISHSWVNISRKNNSNSDHKHNCALAVCYYITTSRDKTGEFMITKTKTKFLPKAGILLVFNGNMQHQVLPHISDDIRISIACNII